MKKTIVTLLLLTLLIIGCNRSTGNPFNSDLVDIGDLGKGYDLVRDTNTGCVYIMETYSTTLTPYYDENGSVTGCGEEDLDRNEYK